MYPEFSASCIDMLVIKIQTTRRKFTNFLFGYLFIAVEDFTGLPSTVYSTRPTIISS
jgi:hypothetical protein